MRDNCSALTTHKVIVAIGMDIRAGAMRLNVLSELFERHGVHRKKRKQLKRSERMVKDIIIEQSAKNLSVKRFH